MELGHPMGLWGFPERPWDEKDWTSSDDRVRGGGSVSRLIVSSSASGTPTAAEFSGNLDITALGGAGFASQRTIDGYPALDLSGFDALVLDLDGGASDTTTTIAAKAETYTLVLKDTVLAKRPDGREQSSVSWEHDFHHHAAGGDDDRVVLRFADFKPMYRGMPCGDDEPPLDWSSVKRVSIMIRSFFGKQEGPFRLVIRSVSATKLADKKHPNVSSSVSAVTSSCSSYPEKGHGDRQDKPGSRRGGLAAVFSWGCCGTGRK
ncbi:complex I intermediate-associated protein 30-domain-containing protein [Podospora didyma]|uniref:Complex I intermediate-associated protein 30-domain-containing protein n=1 Tax=Podospora didyma TaxID=330526 RepID=A0AAE0NH59_9PEZI|nr:complex I intermediate-associated protein 30-domain-containing protein [Podospora didyma]